MYDYPMLPESEYKRLMQAESKGKFFRSRIKPMYAHRTPRDVELQPPKEACCNHPGKACSDDECGECDPGCCPQERGRTAEAVARGLKRGETLMEETQSTALSGVPQRLPKTAEGEVDYGAIPDATKVFEEAASDSTECAHFAKEATEDGSIVKCADCGIDLSPQDDPTALIDGKCRCCGVPLKITPEDAVDLCLECFRSKGGDTNDPCTAAHPICPHGADGRDCDTSCICQCHRRFQIQAPVDVDPVDSEPED